MSNSPMTETGYAQKETKYFGLAREEILPLLPKCAERVLEIGCGAGGTLHWLRSVRPVRYAAGVELMPGPAQQARQVCDDIQIGDIEKMGTLPYAPRSFDLILALDVLEHLAAPWSVIPCLHALLKPGGCLIASIPNVAHYSVSLPLLRGEWTYVKSGILDATHLRFFVRETINELLTCSGLVIDDQQPVIRVPWDLHRVIGWRRNQWLGVTAARYFPHLFTFQYLTRAKNVSH